MDVKRESEISENCVIEMRDTFCATADRPRDGADIPKRAHESQNDLEHERHVRSGANHHRQEVQSVNVHTLGAWREISEIIVNETRDTFCATDNLSRARRIPNTFYISHYCWKIKEMRRGARCKSSKRCERLDVQTMAGETPWISTENKCRTKDLSVLILHAGIRVRMTNTRASCDLTLHLIPCLSAALRSKVKLNMQILGASLGRLRFRASVLSNDPHRAALT